MVSSVSWHPQVLARHLQSHCFSQTLTVLSQKMSLVSPQRSLGQISQPVKPRTGSGRGAKLVCPASPRERGGWCQVRGGCCWGKVAPASCHAQEKLMGVILDI